jgi:hypothetical protein
MFSCHCPAVGFWRKALGLDLPEVVAQASAPTFSIDAGSVEEAAGVVVPAEAIGVSGYAVPTAPVPAVSRRMALQVPAFRRATDLVRVLATLPLNVVKPDLTVAANHWLQQPERDVPRSITYGRLVEDLAHYSIAWWKIIAFDWRGFPAEVVRLDPRTVDVMPDYRVRVTMAGHRGQSYDWPTDGELIRFEMPGAGWLVDGARAIRQCLILDAAAQRYAEGAPPGDYFTDADPNDPLEEDEVEDALTAWQLKRLRRSTGYVPGGLLYHGNQINPEQMELAAQRQHAVLEIARVAGIDAEELGVSTTSRTYSNTFDRRKQYTDFTLGLFRAAIEDRLSMRDVTPDGAVVRFDLDGFLRSDAKSRYEAYALGVQVGAIDPMEIRPAEGKPQIASGTEAPSPAPVPEPTPEPSEVPA